MVLAQGGGGGTGLRIEPRGPRPRILAPQGRVREALSPRRCLPLPVFPLDRAHPPFTVHLSSLWTLLCEMELKTAPASWGWKD